MRRSGVFVVASAVALLAAFLVATLGGGPVLAQTIQTSNATVTSKDPAGIDFGLRVNVAGGLKSARLEYQVHNPDNSVGGGSDVIPSPGNEVDLKFTLGTRDAQRYIPVGSQFTYHWQLVANDGSTTRTPDAEYLFLDGRYQWQSQTQGQVTVYWYGTNNVSAQAALQSSLSSLQDTSALLNATVTYSIRVIVWKSEDEGKAAMRAQSAAFDAQIETGGQRVAPDILFVFDNMPDVVRHETGHIVTHVAGDGPFVGLPSWLDEGTAVYMQKSPGGYEPAVRSAVQSNKTLSLRSMQTAPTRPEEVNLFYGQSWSTVKFMNDEYGQAKFAQLFRTVKEGARIDDALTTVYGFNQDGLYNAWRQKNGLPAVATTGPTQAGPATAQGTRAPLGIPTSSGGASSQPTAAGTSSGSAAATAAPTASADDSSSSSSKTAGILVLAVTVLIAVALGGGGFYLLRKRRA